MEARTTGPPSAPRSSSRGLCPRDLVFLNSMKDHGKTQGPSPLKRLGMTRFCCKHSSHTPTKARTILALDGTAEPCRQDLSWPLDFFRIHPQRGLWLRRHQSLLIFIFFKAVDYLFYIYPVPLYNSPHK